MQGKERQAEDKTRRKRTQKCRGANDSTVETYKASEKKINNNVREAYLAQSYDILYIAQQHAMCNAATRSKPRAHLIALSETLLEKSSHVDCAPSSAIRRGERMARPC